MHVDDRIRIAARDEAVRLHDPYAAPIRIWHPDANSSSYRICRERHHDEGEGADIMFYSGPPPMSDRPNLRIVKAAKAAVRSHARLRRRAGAIAEVFHHTHLKPWDAKAHAWAVRAHDVLIAMAMHHGMDPVEMATPHPDVETAGRDRLQALRRRGTMTRPLTFAQGTVRIEGEHLRHGIIRGRDWRLEDDGDGVRMHIDAEVPEMAMHAAAGRRLCEVVAHPALAGLDVRIERMWSDAGEVVLSITDSRSWLALPPPCADTTWMRI